MFHKFYPLTTEHDGMAYQNPVKVYQNGKTNQISFPSDDYREMVHRIGIHILCFPKSKSANTSLKFESANI